MQKLRIAKLCGKKTLQIYSRCWTKKEERKVFSCGNREKTICMVKKIFNFSFFSVTIPKSFPCGYTVLGGFKFCIFWNFNRIKRRMTLSMLAKKYVFTSSNKFKNVRFFSIVFKKSLQKSKYEQTIFL